MAAPHHQQQLTGEKRKVALITGITGQDGAYLTELLLEKGYEVHGIMRRSSSFNTSRIDHLYQDSHEDHRRLILHYGDVCDSTNLISILTIAKPTEVYNLAAQSHVKVSFELPEYTANVDGLGALRLLEAIRIAGLSNTCKFYQASTSELFGLVRETPQTERTPFYPRSPYAVAKQFAYWIVVNYREAYGMHASNGILFNHESPRRGATFVTRKITRNVACVAMKGDNAPCLYLGNINAKRDWGHARDYVRGMWMILQQEKPDDFVLATGYTCSVRDFVQMAFAVIGIAITWEGEGLNEVGKDAKTGRIYVRIDPRYFRPTEVDLLLGDASKAKRVLGWEATTPVQQLAKEMVEHDIKLLKAGDLYS